MQNTQQANRQPSQQSVARKAGVSRATVSMALSGDLRIAESTRQRVLAAAESLGYHAGLNVDARRLGARSNGRNLPFGIMGLVWQDSGTSMVGGSFQRVLLDGLVEGAWQSGKALLLMNMNESELHLLSRAGQVDGIILPSMTNRSHGLSQRLGKPLVTIMSSAENETDALNVGIDGRHAVRMAFEHLWSRGHRRIGYVGPPDDQRHSAERLSEFRKCLSKHGISEASTFVFTAPQITGSFERLGSDALAQFRKWRGPRPTAVVSYNDAMSLGLLEAARAANVDVPGDLSVVSIDDIPEAALCKPSLTTVSINIQEMGRRAALMLAELVDGHELPSKQVLVELSLVERESVRSV